MRTRPELASVMAIPLSDDTIRAVERRFTPSRQGTARALLVTRCGASLPFMADATPQALERIRFAAIKMSHGSIDELARAIDIANVDWRDLLVAAGFACDLVAHEKWFESIT